KRENWVILEDGETKASYDLFYIYPTLVSHKKKPYMDWSDPKTAAKTVGFVTAQTKGIFGGDARVFAPYVRQLEYTRIKDFLSSGKASSSEDMTRGCEDTLEAFLYYLKHYNNGRPFVLLGHSQGSMDLYYVLRVCPVFSGKSSFVAAYLPGLRVTFETWEKDFRTKAIAPAKGEKDVRCVIFWNTQNEEAADSLFSGKGALCINPLSWTTGETPADASLNKGAFFYDYRNGKSRKVPRFCGAFVSREKGALIVNLPSMSQYDAKGFMGKGVFHMNDIWFFAENIRLNASARVNEWKKEKTSSLPGK
ncbi:MAG: DUF3089 domain-containing protein, partial [Lentisphaeria bacterium]|nr:DUF3089 domain-containing protein [Lentisphaeria bacterium]